MGISSVTELDHDSALHVPSSSHSTSIRTVPDLQSPAFPLASAIIQSHTPSPVMSWVVESDLHLLARSIMLDESKNLSQEYACFSVVSSDIWSACMADLCGPWRGLGEALCPRLVQVASRCVHRLSLQSFSGVSGVSLWDKWITASTVRATWSLGSLIFLMSFLD